MLISRPLGQAHPNFVRTGIEGFTAEPRGQENVIALLDSGLCLAHNYNEFRVAVTNPWKSCLNHVWLEFFGQIDQGPPGADRG